MEIHPIKPSYDENSQILILGSFPSVKSREEKYFYAHKQNRFWKVISALYDEKEPQTIKEKEQLLKRNHIALWDVIKTCNIQGSSDSSIKDVQVNNLEEIIKKSKIKKIYVNGRKAQDLYKKYIEPKNKIKAIYLPSTSPANAIYSLEKLIEKWQIIKNP